MKKKLHYRPSKPKRNNQMPNKYFFSILALSAVAVIGTFTPLRQSSAHVLETDGSMGAVLHIDPNDAPVAQQPAYFFLDFASKTGTFDLANCTCTATLTTADGMAVAQPVVQAEQGQSSEGTFQYQFQNAAEYILTVNGVPVSGNAFQKFTLIYTFQVAPSSGSAASGSTNAFKSFFSSEHGLHYVLFGAGFIVIFFLFLNEYKKNKKSHPLINSTEKEPDEIK
jgi:hypothetical protein